MQLGGLTAGVPFGRTFLRVSAPIGPRLAAMLTVGAGLVSDLSLMNPALDLWVDRHPPVHAGEHGLPLLLNAVVGAAWSGLVGASVCTAFLLVALMAGMVLAGGS